VTWRFSRSNYVPFELVLRHQDGRLLQLSEIGDGNVRVSISHPQRDAEGRHWVNRPAARVEEIE
jgi:hypothetical protein